MPIAYLQVTSLYEKKHTGISLPQTYAAVFPA